MSQPNRDLLTGANLTDVREGEPHNTDAGTYNYYGYNRPNGLTIIMREKDDLTEYRFFVGNSKDSSYSTNFTNRQSKVYSTPDKYDLS